MEEVNMFKVRWIRALILIIAVGLMCVSGTRTKAAPTLAVGIYCISLGHARLECHADVSGGTGSYSYAWTPTPTQGGSGQDFVIVRCAAAYTNQGVSLTVTDSNGATGSDSTVHYCGNAE
jgi:hypothetical protein